MNFNNSAEVIGAIDYFDLNGSWAVNDIIAIRAVPMMAMASTPPAV